MIDVKFTSADISLCETGCYRLSIREEMGKWDPIHLSDFTYHSLPRTGVPNTALSISLTSTSSYNDLLARRHWLDADDQAATSQLVKCNGECVIDAVALPVTITPLGSLLGGAVQEPTPVCPLHASFPDVLMGPERNDPFCVDTREHQKAHAFATLHVTKKGSRFNMVNLKHPPCVTRTCPISHHKQRRTFILLPSMLGGSSPYYILGAPAYYPTARQLSNFGLHSFCHGLMSY